MSDPRTKAATFYIAGLHCADEFAVLERGLQPLQGVRRIAPDYVNRLLHVEFEAAHLDAAKISQQLRDIGFPGTAADQRTERGGRPSDAAPLRLTTLAGGFVLVVAGVCHWVSAPMPVVAVLAIISTALSGWPVAWAALRAVRLRRLDMNALMTIAAIGALATAYWLEAPTAMFLFGISLWLESFSLRRASRAVRSLVELTPAVAHRVDEANADIAQARSARATTDVSPDEIHVGDCVLVKPGERVPVDGVVVSGASVVNQAPITGESIPIEKAPGDQVYAGSLNGEGLLEIRTQRPAQESTLAHVARLVQQAQANRSPTERFVDAFARRYTPAVIALAVCIAFGPPLLAWLGMVWASGTGFSAWLHRGLVLLVIACPCALVISTPITIVCGLHQATRLGILIKGGEFLESAGRLDALAIDKTGTLTLGEPAVVRVVGVNQHSQNDVLSIAAALETGSEHPLALAIVESAKRSELNIPAVADFAAMRGFGVQGRIGGVMHYVASPRFFYERKVGGESVPDNLLGGDGAATVALVGTDERLLGAVYLADQSRDDAAQSLDELRRLGVNHVVMITGDHPAPATRIAHELGIERVHAELLPDQKVKLVERLKGEFSNLAMVGDGVNDAPALAASSVGIALGAQSSDTALETADVVVMAPRLNRLVELVRLGQRTRRVLWQNIFLALFIKGTVLALALAGLATMWMAVAADVGASLLVIANGMRLLGPTES